MCELEKDCSILVVCADGGQVSLDLLLAMHLFCV